ncbi:endonuclease MutS2 [Alloprevotella sp. OH1205_COT-284]|uniref:endonuclease MutS2 n=1 Tax=Alloprevotella sp. OH1205_COT-284 TaxID=2491043 RepID=UPI000F5E8E1C|nr:Smr/MutS family protein [Alloprevotella sp. OH1205_COT-284]RRD76319.1 endonuclease MutS2 [Alloprevotella sp. OH1205_COT-284]
MIYPDHFERKIGFSEVRTLLKGRCMSTLGTEWVDNHVRFSSCYEEVKEALEQAREFGLFMAEEEDVYEENFYDVRQSLMRIRPERTYLEELDLFDLKRSLQTVVSLVSFLRKDEEVPDAPDEENADERAAAESGKNAKYPALFRMTEGIGCFPQIIRRIDTVLNKYGKVKDTATPELLSIRHNMEVTARSISHSLRSIINEAQAEGYIERDVSPTLRDGRLVIPVAPALKRKIKGIIHDESATGKTVFIEPAAVVDANNRVRELKAAEKREIIRILQILSSEIRPHINDILHSMHFLAHIDYLRALAVFSENFGSIVPRLRREPRLDWVQARHPLLQQSLERHDKKMVPLDITLRDRARILLISGPNAGGKSVCLKTAGLLQYMLQCGMPVPVRENSTAGIFEDIFIDIGDEQSLENDLSTYSSHLLNMKAMMKHCTSKSLLLIDEFGSGTEPQIGGAMAEAILQQFVERNACGIITTHYQNLKHFAETTSAVVNGAMLYDRSKMQPLFVLQIGNPGSSFAVEIARKIGIPESVIAYASDLVGKDYVMSDKYLQDIVRDKMYWENKRRNIHDREKKLEQTIAKYEEELSTISKEKREVLTEARQEAERLLQESNAMIENTIRAIKESQAERERTQLARRELQDFRQNVTETDAAAKADAISKKMEQIRRRQERRKDRKNQPSASETVAFDGKASASDTPPMATGKAVTVGGYVRIKGQSVVGCVESIQGKTARVLFGVMLTTVPLKRLEATEKPEEKPTVSKVSTFISKETRDAMYEKKLRFRPEIDLRGMHGEEAVTAVHYFIDDAILLEQRRVRILHGTGTGALRTMIRRYLDTVAGVSSYRDEHVQFGGAGITIVELG